MTFAVSAEAYEEFMGRFSRPLAAEFADFAGVVRGSVPHGWRALDVGCGPGALTAVLVERLGASSVSALDPSATFVAAAQERFPEVDVRTGGAEALPYADGTFDVALAQLVVPFMADPVAGLAEMGRVTRTGGSVAACVWDHAGGGGPLSLFWEAARAVDPDARDEADLAGAREGHLEELCAAAGLRPVASGRLQVAVRFASFEQWWRPYTFGVGPAGAYVAGLTEAGREAVRQRCADLLPPAPFSLTGAAWAVRATT